MKRDQLIDRIYVDIASAVDTRVEATVSMEADVQPNDIVVVRLDRSMPMAQIHSMKDALERVVPEGVKTVILGPGTELKVVRGVATIRDEREEQR